MTRLLRTAAFGLLGLILAIGHAAGAQSVIAIPKLNLDQFTVPWYEQARLPDKREKPCVSDTLVLYSLGDKKSTFQGVISCLIKNGNWQSWNQNGKLDPAGTGRLKTKGIWPFTHPYWVIAAGPDMKWMVVGTPNHKSLWLLSRERQAAADIAAEMRSRAAAQGYDVSKLITVIQHQDLTSGTPAPARSQAPTVPRTSTP